MNVLIVEDDDSVGRFLSQALAEAGYGTRLAIDGPAGLHAAREGWADLILLDVMLPGVGGLELCRTLRAEGIEAPVLMITARDLVEDKIAGLDSGADDYLVKPFQLGELLARVRALLRRPSASPGVLHVGDLSLDPVTRKAVRGNRAIHLSATEYALLEFLMRHAERVLLRAEILQHVWQYDFEGNDNVLDVYISYLRGKIDRGSSRPLIHTVRGVGFRMSADAAP